MTVQEVLERVGSRQTGVICAYINDALLEIEEMSADKVKRYKYDIEEDVRYYALPTDMINLLGVYRKYDENGKFIPCPMIQNVDIQQDDDVSSTTDDDDIIII